MVADIATAWEALFTFDLMIFGLTIARTYKTRISYGVGRRMDLVTLMVRDGKETNLRRVCTWCALADIVIIGALYFG